MPIKSLKSKIKYRIGRARGVVFTPKDFLDLSDRDQIGRVLRQMVAAGELIKFGQGLYAKSKVSKLTGKIIPAKPLPELAREALTEKLKVKVVLAMETEAYNSGSSTQIPTGRVIAV